MENDIQLKKFHWIKLKKDFMSSDEVDFLMSQKNGSNYVVLYQMLCLMTIKSMGRLERQLNEVLVPYDIEKIQRDTRYFDIDTVRIALELFKKLGLIYTDENNTLIISNFHELIGGESASAERVRKHRESKKLLQCNTNVTEDVTKCNDTNDVTKMLESNTYIELESEIELDIEKDINNNVVVVNNTCISDNNDNNKKTHSHLLIDFWEKEVARPLTPSEIDFIHDFRTRHDDAVIKYAMKLTIANGKRNIGYLRTILNNYFANGLKTVVEIMEHEESRFKKIRTYHENKQEMILPDYYTSEITHNESLDITNDEIESLKKKLKESST